MSAPPHGNAMNEQIIRNAIRTVYDKIFNEGQAELLPGWSPAPPSIPDGLRDIMSDIKQTGGIPCKVKRVAMDGDSPSSTFTT
jgi:hypothetical protein